MKVGDNFEGLGASKELFESDSTGVTLLNSWEEALSEFTSRGWTIEPRVLWLTGYAAGSARAAVSFTERESADDLTEAADGIRTFVSAMARDVESRDQTVVDVEAFTAALGLCPVWPIC